nr:MAG TPA: hypothetical protein [Caudoviricetes sp.]
MLIKVDSDRSEATMVIGDKVAQLLKENGKKVLNYNGFDGIYSVFNISDFIIFVANADVELDEPDDRAKLMYGLTEFININGDTRYTDIAAALGARVDNVQPSLISNIVTLCADLNDVWRDNSMYDIESDIASPELITKITLDKIELRAKLVQLFSTIVKADEVFVLGSWVKTQEFSYMNRAIRDRIDSTLVDSVKAKLSDYKDSELAYRTMMGYQHKLLDIVALPSLLMNNDEYELFKEHDINNDTHVIGYKVIPKLGHDVEFVLSYRFNDYEVDDKLEEILKEL